MPRSLAFCSNWMQSSLDLIDKLYGARTIVHDMADEMNAMLNGIEMDAIFQRGLHEFLVEFIGRNNALTDALTEHYNFY